MKHKHEIIMGYRGLPFKISTHKVEKIGTHWHEHLEILLVLKGSVEIRINNQLYTVKEDDILLINSHEIHSTRRTEEDNLLLLIQLDGRYYSTYYPEFRNMIFEREYFNCKHNKNDSEILKVHLAKIVWQLHKKDIGYRFSIGSEVVLLLSHVMRSSRESELKELSQADKDDQLSKIKEILDYINDNFEQGITLNDIANKVYFSAGHLSRFFKEMMGISFQEYLDYIRIDKASELLLSTNKLITEVAHESGLSSTKTLNRLFRDHFDCTPSEFRSNYENIIKRIENGIEINDKESKSYLDINKTDEFKKLFEYLDFQKFDNRSRNREFKLNYNTKSINTSILEKGKSFTDYWRNLTTLGRASKGLRSDVQAQIIELQEDIRFKYIKFDGIFSNDMMIYNTDKEGKVVYNWNSVNKLFDFFKDVNIKPFIGLGFMTTQLRNSEDTMWELETNMFKSNDINFWKDLVIKFIKHCVNRYGLEEIESWYFEICNQSETEQMDWTFNKEDYFEFYKETVKAIKSISKQLKVGGPSITTHVICDNEWIDEFLSYCNEKKVPLDYISLHIYNEKFAVNSDSTDLESLIYVSKYKDNTPDTLDFLHHKMSTYIEEKTEIHVTEWNVSSKSGSLIHDTCFIANFIIDNVLKCIGKTKSLGYGTFTDIIGEVNYVKEEFHGGFGLITMNDLKKPSYFAYAMLSKLGDEIIAKGDEYIVTRRDENIQILTYNYAYFDDLSLKGNISALSDKQRYNVFEEKITNKVEIHINDIKGYYKETKYKLDRENGSVYDDWIRMGSPENMNKEELEYLKGRSYPKTTIDYLKVDGSYNCEIYTKPHGIDLIILEKK